MLKKLILAMSLLGLSSLALAEDDIYKKGQDKAFTAGCINATTRTDGTTLPIEEIAEVIYFIDSIDGNTVAPLYSVVMTGGCSDVIVDLTQFPTNVTLYKFAITVDTNALVSVPSLSRSFKIQSANPNAPGQIR